MKKLHSAYLFFFFLSIVPAQAVIFDFILNPFGDSEIGHWVEGDYMVDDDVTADSCGLKNLGNTCYMNALLQNLYRAWGPLSYNDSLMKALRASGFVDYRVARCKISKKQAEREQFLLIELFNLFRGMSETERIAIRPKKFLEVFFSVVDENELLQDDFVRGGQSDSQQLFECLTDIFSDFLEYAQKNSAYGIGLVSCGHCLECKNSSREVQKQLRPNLLVEITAASLNGCLDVFFQERICGIEGGQDNRVSCDVCKLKQEATRKVEEQPLQEGAKKVEVQSLQEGTRKFEVQSLSQFLHIQLNRFRSNNTGFVVSKIKNHVSLPPVLDVKKYVEQDSKIKTTYGLIGIVFHAGTAKGGHYFSAVKNKTDNAWFLYNDSSVSFLDEAEVEAMFAAGQLSAGVWSGQAYLLCYEQI